MKRILLFLLMAAFVTSCNNDSSQVDQEDEGAGSREAKRKELCAQMNTTISSLQTIISALQQEDPVISLEPVDQEEKTIGYKIGFAENGAVTIYTVQDETGGTAPIVGVKKHTDGIYYWTLNGEFVECEGVMLPAQKEDEEKVPASTEAVVPQLKVEKDTWYISYDQGAGWLELEPAGDSQPDSMFRKIDQDLYEVHLTLSNGEIITLARKQRFDLVLKHTEGIICSPGKSVRIDFTLEGDLKEVTVKATGKDGWKAEVQMKGDSEGYVEVTAPTKGADSEVSVLAKDKDGYSVYKTLDFIMGELTTEEEYNVDAQAQQLEVEVHTNLDYTVYIPEDAAGWISRVESRGELRKDKVIFDITALEEGESRRTQVELRDADGNSLKTIKIRQGKTSPFYPFFELTFEVLENYPMEFTVRSAASSKKIEYHMGIMTAKEFDEYENWHQMVETLKAAGTLEMHTNRWTMTRLECKRNTEYVVYGFAYADGVAQSDLFVQRVITADIPFDFNLEFKEKLIEKRKIGVEVTPPNPRVWYHVGIVTAEYFDRYSDVKYFIKDLIHSDGGGALAQYVGVEYLEAGCTPGTEYVIYGFAYGGNMFTSGEVLSNVSTARVTTLPLPRNYNVDVSATWKVYDGRELAALYPQTYKDVKDERCVFIFSVTPANAETVHYWGFLHIGRSVMNLPDMLIFDYLEVYPMFGWLDSPYGRYSLPDSFYDPAKGGTPAGFFYVGQDADDAWGTLHYEEIDFTSVTYSDPKDAPTEGFDDKKDWSVKGLNTYRLDPAAAKTFSAPVRFSKASLMQTEQERRGTVAN